MKRLCLSIILMMFYLFQSIPSHALTIVDTGSSSSPRSWAFSDVQWLAAKFTLDQSYYLTDIAGWVRAPKTGEIFGEKFSISVYGSAGETPDTTNLIYNNQVTIMGTSGANWEGYHIPWGNGLELSAGDYWLGFEIRIVNGDDYNGSMPFPVTTPLADYAANSTGTWYGYDKLDIGVRILGDRVATVPEPATFILLGSGLAGLAFYRRKRK